MQSDRVSVWPAVTFDVLDGPTLLADFSLQQVVVVVARRSGVIAQPAHDALPFAVVGASLHQWSDKSVLLPESDGAHSRSGQRSRLELVRQVPVATPAAARNPSRRRVHRRRGLHRAVDRLLPQAGGPVAVNRGPGGALRRF